MSQLRSSIIYSASCYPGKWSYFPVRYVIDEIKRRLKTGRPLSGFTIPSWGEDVVLIAFGDNRRSGKMHVAGIQMNHETQPKKLLGAVYCECEVNEEEFWMMDSDVESVEKICRCIVLFSHW